MAKILCVGIATVDIVNEVAMYPTEDDEIRIVTQDKRRGGNAANTAVILSQLGHECYWAGTLVKEIDCHIILDDFKRYQVNDQFCHFLEQGKVPTSYIVLSQATASRTISHFRDLPEYDFSEFKKIPLEAFEHIHFEGRNIDQSLKMMHYAKYNYPKKMLSVELEKPRKGSEQLIDNADIIIFSKNYARQYGFDSAQAFLQSFNDEQSTHKILICAWGDSGAVALVKRIIYHQEAIKVNAVDTLGAGDVFNAGIIDQLLTHNNISLCLKHACQLAAMQCTKKGLNLEPMDVKEHYETR
ncbi:MAG: ketohexokinase [Gammaproteobacteria bacterium]|nr:ketohexokinase [Gammaproteobacteria bacterium]